MLCPECKGTGDYYEEHPYGDGVAREKLTCPACMGDGEGVADPERIARIKKDLDAMTAESNFLMEIGPGMRSEWPYACPCCGVEMHYSHPKMSFLGDHYDMYASCGCKEPVRFQISRLDVIANDALLIGRKIQDAITSNRERTATTMGTEHLSGDAFAHRMRTKRMPF